MGDGVFLEMTNFANIHKKYLKLILFFFYLLEESVLPKELPHSGWLDCKGK